MTVRSHRPALGKVEQNMTPMIDVVFQLLAFFVMTFKIVTVEGDFNVKMPQFAPGSSLAANEFQSRLALFTDDSGRLVDLRWNDRSLGVSFADLQREIIALPGTETSVSSLAKRVEVELDCDPRLHYVHVIRAITTLSGYVNQRGETVRLIERIKFTPTRP